MLKGLTLQELAAKIEFNKGEKKDFIADTSTLRMVVEDNAPRIVVPKHGEFNIRPLAHDQIGGRLNIPSKYYDKMLTAAPDLLATNVNRWFKEAPEKRMTRMMGNDMRAFLSNRYARIENEEVAEVALPILAAIPNVKIVACEITERRMYIQAVSPRVQGEVAKGDVVQAGVIISNSEVGAGAVSVASVIWRLVCLNGMISSDKFRAYHVGRHIEDNAELWADDTRKADDRAVLLKVRDMVTAAVDAQRFAARIEQMKALTGIIVSGNPASAVEVLAQKVGASEEEKGGILRSLISGGDLSAWGLLNAVTAQAHKAKSFDRAVEFEAAGGQLLELSKSEWTRVLEAA